MVTTRGGHDTHSPAVEAPAGKTGTKRAAGQRDSPVPAKRRRAVSEEADTGTYREESLRRRATNGRTKSEEAVNTSAAQRSAGSLERTRRSPEVVIEVPSQRQKQQIGVSTEKAQQEDSPSSGPDSVYATPATQGAASVYATPATDIQRPGQASAKRTPASHIPATRLAPVDEGSRRDAEGSNVATTSQESKAEGSIWSGRAKQRRNLDPNVTISEKQGDLQTSAKADSTSGPLIPQRKHIRFDENGDAPTGEENPSVALNLSEIPSSSEAKEIATGETSEDEAPETVSKTSAVEAARAADVEATRAIEQQEAAARKKRQERDARLKEQAGESRRNKKRLRPTKTAQTDEQIGTDAAMPEDAEENDVSALPPKYDIHNLPALLPPELLAAACAPPPPTPPPVTTAPSIQSRAVQQNQRLKFLDAATKAPKDVKRGPVKVRVLTEMNKLLAPKIDVNGRNMRETWLAGRRSRGGAAKFEKTERRAIKGGFLRK